MYNLFINMKYNIHIILSFSAKLIIFMDKGEQMLRAAEVYVYHGLLEPQMRPAVSEVPLISYTGLEC